MSTTVPWPSFLLWRGRVNITSPRGATSLNISVVFLDIIPFDITVSNGFLDCRSRRLYPRRDCRDIFPFRVHGTTNRARFPAQFRASQHIFCYFYRGARQVGLTDVVWGREIRQPGHLVSLLVPQKP